MKEWRSKKGVPLVRFMYSGLGQIKQIADVLKMDDK